MSIKNVDLIVSESIKDDIDALNDNVSSIADNVLIATLKIGFLCTENVVVGACRGIANCLNGVDLEFECSFTNFLLTLVADPSKMDPLNLTLERGDFSVTLLTDKLWRFHEVTISGVEPTNNTCVIGLKIRLINDLLRG